MIDYQKLIEKMEGTVYDINPYLRKIKQSGDTVANYYADAYDYRVDEAIFPESIIFKKIISEHVNRIYGVGKRKLVEDYLESCFMADTATHFSLPRTYDNISGVDYDCSLTWNSLLVSVAMAKYKKRKVHFGIYSTDINLTTINSPGVIELTPYNYCKIFNVKERKNSVRFFQVDNTRIASCLEELKNLTIRNALMQLAKYERTGYCDVSIHKIIQNGEKVSINRSGHQIDKIISDYNRSIDLINLIPKLIREEDLCYDKLVFFHKYLFDELINSKESQIEQITISSDVLIDFLINQLEDKNTLLYHIFSNKCLLDMFVSNLADLRSGWKTVISGDKVEYNSPFLKKVKNGELKRLETDSYCFETHSTEILVTRLKNREVIPTTIMYMAIYLITGFLPLGGMLQSYYAKELQVRLATYLEPLDPIRAIAIKSMPIEISLHTLAFDVKDNMQLFTYADLLNMNKYVPQILENIPQLSLNKAYYNALPTLYNFFVYYVLSSKEHNYKNIVSHIDKELYYNYLLWRGIIK